MVSHLDIIVHPSAAARIDRLKKSLPQGLLLSGDSGTGLATIARDIARALTKNTVMVIPEKGTITIDMIRQLYSVARTNAGPVVIVIDDSDAMGREASNALLKLLEEPGTNLRFILTSHNPTALLPTILSRVQAVEIPRVTPAQSGRLMDGLGVTDPTKRSQLAFIAGGLPAALTRYAGDDASFAARAKTVRDARGFLSGTREDRLVLAASYGSDRPAALGLVRDMMRLVRMSAKTAVGDTTVRTLDGLLLAERDLAENASVRLCLTHAALTV